MIEWDKINDNIEEISFKGQEKIGKVVSVYDGDSIKIVFPLINDMSNTLYKWNCRLINIDTPEIRTRNLKEKEFGLKIRDILRDKILNKIVTIKCHDFDKFGRLLVEVFIKEIDMSTINKITSVFSSKKNNNLISINEWLIKNNYARVYTGGKREPWNL
tara:strand:+ start:325 stop:801 length:477 start_codon:yes stop_codon:yes gene_type:complete